MTYAKGEQNTGNYENNALSTELKINPIYEIQTRPHTSSEYKRLKDSMMEFGLKEPIRVDEAGYILDGHHRLKICKELGIEPQIVIVRCENEQQKIRLINQLNTARRHLTRWELYLTAEKMRPEIELQVRSEQQLKYQKGKKGTQPIGVKSLTPIDNLIGNTNKDADNEDSDKKAEGRVNSIIGQMADLSSTTVWKWKQVRDNATCEQSNALTKERKTPQKVYEEIKAAKRQDEIIRQAKEINTRFSLPKRATVYCGDFRDPAILAQIPDGSVSLIILDPPYAEEYWYLYEALPSIAMAKLKPNGHFVSLFGDTMKRKFMNILEAEGLVYNTDISIQLEGPFHHDQDLHISRKKKDLLWYYKGPKLITNGLLQNLIQSRQSEKDLHEWQQSTIESQYIISMLTFAGTGDIILDLMMGAGTNIKAALSCGGGRKGIGIEIDKLTLEKAKANLSSPSDIQAESNEA